MGDDNPTRGQQILDHSQAERKPEIQPDRMGNHLSGKSVAAIKWVTGNIRHAHSSHAEIDRRLMLRS
ncbi:hypothetical protein, partial [Rhizobium sp. P32RR-XVIII]|uniref:hypothetical protein n=1 Tax=Rhizobium sp. P32RR-XVIII TaxID=2726738 RepID=UPI0028AB89CA